MNSPISALICDLTYVAQYDIYSCMDRGDGARSAPMEIKMTNELYEKAKEIAKILDRAAARAQFPASSKQVFFLAKLMAERDEDGSDWLLDTSRRLSGREASSLIDSYLN